MSTAASPALRLRDYAALVKLSHSVFALPFALLSLLAATGGSPAAGLLLLVIVAVVAARTAAMAYNRYADRRIDALNPRTAGREIPRGVVTPRAALALVAGSSSLFLLVCYLLGPACFAMAPPTLAFLLLYSHTKRHSALCHLWLGVALGLSPVAAWLAADGEFSARLWLPCWLGFGVAVWVAGFDILYACQDEDFDRKHGLHSLPVRFGARRAMWCSRVLHALALVAFGVFGLLLPLGPGYSLGLLLSAGFLVWQHWLLRANDLSRIELAFFTANGAIAILLLVAAVLDIYWLARQG